MTKRSLFGSTGKTSRLYPASTLDRACHELDLRAEFDDLVFGSDGCIRHGQLLAVRHMRRTADGKRIACACKDKFSGECEPSCSYCYGESWLWDEQWYMGRVQYLGSDGGLGNRYRFSPGGEVRADTKIFYLRYDVPLKYGDKIIEMLLDEEGDPVVPYVREAIYKPQTIDRLRSDHGRIEFIAAYCLEKDAIRPDVFQ